MRIALGCNYVSSCPAPSVFGTLPPLQRIWPECSVSLLQLWEWLAAICHHCRACSTPRPSRVQERLSLTPLNLNRDCSKPPIWLEAMLHQDQNVSPQEQLRPFCCSLTQTLAPLPTQSHSNASSAVMTLFTFWTGCMTVASRIVSTNTPTLLHNPKLTVAQP